MPKLGSDEPTGNQTNGSNKMTHLNITTAHGTFIGEVSPSGEITGTMTLEGLRKKHTAAATFTSTANLVRAAIEGTFNRVQDRLGRKGILGHEVDGLAVRVLAAIGDGTYGTRRVHGDPIEKDIRAKLVAIAIRRLTLAGVTEPTAADVDGEVANIPTAKVDAIRQAVEAAHALMADALEDDIDGADEV